jgi:hypothetical protein
MCEGIFLGGFWEASRGGDEEYLYLAGCWQSRSGSCGCLGDSWLGVKGHLITCSDDKEIKILIQVKKEIFDAISYLL